MATWGFESGTQSWVGTNCTPSQDPGWHSAGSYSLLLFCPGTGNPSARSPSGTSGVACSPGQFISVSADVEGYSGSTGWSACYIGIQWFQASGTACTHPQDNSSTSAIGPSSLRTMTLTATAPAGAAFYDVIVGNSGNTITGTYMGYIDNVNAAPLVGFPGKSLGLKVELLLNGAWTDITAYVYQRNDIDISPMGHADEATTIQPVTATMTLKNLGGRFVPKNTAGAYYPYITRNAQLRVSVNALSMSGINYSGYRFWGEVTEWPSAWDPRGRDVNAQITANGIWRRVSTATTPLGSPYRRYHMKLTGTAKPQAYWPMEDGNGSAGFVNYLPGTPVGTSGTWSPTSSEPGLAGNSMFNGSDAIPSLNTEAITFTVPAGGTPTNNVTRFLLSVPQAGDTGPAATGTWDVIEIDTAGTVAKFNVYLHADGTLALNGLNAGGTQLFTTANTNTDVQGMPLLVSVEATPSGGSLAYALRIINPGSGVILESKTGTLASASVGAVTQCVFGRFKVLSDTSVGHLSVTYGSVPSMITAAYALNGYTGEFAADRFTRLCTEQNIGAEVIGTSSASAPMGPQVDDTLANLLQVIEDTDCGMLYESRNAFALGYRTKASMMDQSVALTLDYAAKTIDSEGMQSTYDDQLTINDVTVTNWDAYAWEQYLFAGPMSIQPPPAGIGSGYATTRSVCVAADSQVQPIASWLLSRGAVDEVRYPVISVNLSAPGNAVHFSDVPSIRPGDYLQITNPPAWVTASTIGQLIWGYSEKLNARTWTFSFNCIPRDPWVTGFSPGTVTGGQVSSASAENASSSSASSLATAIGNNGMLGWTALTSVISFVSALGVQTTVSATAPLSPNPGDLWFASAAGMQLFEWTGSSWVPYTFGTQAISNNAITSALMASGAAVGNLSAGAITASLLAANAALGNIGTGGITSGYIAANAVVAGAIAANVITSREIQSGTITAADIAANTITSTQLASGLVMAGIVDATTITGANFVAYGASGEILAYSGTPAAGNIVASVSPAGGTDSYGNIYRKGTVAYDANSCTQVNADGILFCTGSPTGGWTAETWHTIGTSLNNGWSGTFRLQILPIGQGVIYLDANLTGVGTVADGTVLWTLGATYSPVSAKRICVYSNHLKVSPVGSGYEGACLYIGASGQIQCYGIGTSASIVQGTGSWPMPF